MLPKANVQEASFLHNCAISFDINSTIRSIRNCFLVSVPLILSLSGIPESGRRNIVSDAFSLFLTFFWYPRLTTILLGPISQ